MAWNAVNGSLSLRQWVVLLSRGDLLTTLSLGHPYPLSMLWTQANEATKHFRSITITVLCNVWQQDLTTNYYCLHINVAGGGDGRSPRVVFNCYNQTRGLAPNLREVSEPSYFQGDTRRASNSKLRLPEQLRPAWAKQTPCQYDRPYR